MVEIETVEDEDSDDTPPAIQLGFSEPIRPDTADIVTSIRSLVERLGWRTDWRTTQLVAAP